MFHGPLTYASTMLEVVDWSLFDYIGIDHKSARPCQYPSADQQVFEDLLSLRVQRRMVQGDQAQRGNLRSMYSSAD